MGIPVKAPDINESEADFAAVNGIIRYGLHGIKFEIQCRTILQNAWASVSHRLAYKGEASIPEALRKDFHALAGLFYVADKHFELLKYMLVMLLFCCKIICIYGI